ncbi:MAG TPA: TadE/TadG family type IV pilus assembly protein [Gemmatimonadales bacterium]
MKKRFHIRNRRGQALVEFALVLPILMLMVVGLIEMARAWNLHQVITDASREGCRLAVIADPAVTQATVDSAIQNRIASAGFDPTLVAITFPDGFHTGSGNVTACRIKAAYQFGLLGPLMRIVSPSTNGVINMITIARMRNE